jgi:16S rRNA (adenine1518-N6/adenine1519-N6)-dimethyltransferase
MNDLLTDPEYLDFILKKNKIRADKTLGQNFLISQEVVDAIILGLEDEPKHVTELGPGLGTLTQGLIASGFHVRAIEKDDDFISIIPRVLPANLRENLELIHGDLKDIDWMSPASTATSAKQEWSLVGNIPYNLSGLIIRHLTKLQTAPERAIFLMQKEVVDRLVTEQGNMSLLGLSLGLWGTATLLLRVPPSCFIPQPSVQSSLVLLQPNSIRLPVEKREEIIAKAKPFFQAKRKQISTTMKRAYLKTDEEIDFITQQLSISKQARPQDISIDTWARLCDIL